MSPLPELPVPAVAELQGLHGAFSFPERILQKIWLRGEFDLAAATVTDGRRLHLRSPGRWNHLGGPDFAGARLRLGDGPELVGDVEVHLRAGDWDTHGHAADPAYDRVCLHVVLFLPSVGQVTRGVGGSILPVLVLWPLLQRSLEEHAADDAVESLARRPLAAWTEEFARGADAGVASCLAARARERWGLKVHFARLRIAQLGWEEACHYAALEILGYRFNRAPMLRVAGRHPLAAWTLGQVDPSQVLAEETAWKLQGSRPSNHPCRRLSQYAAWVQRCPAWPSTLREVGAGLPIAVGIEESTAQVRRQADLGGWRGRLTGALGAGAVSGPRLDTLICDGALPLLAAELNKDLFPLWWHWPVGDLPPVVTAGLRALGVCEGRSHPRHHGAAQGLLAWLIAQERI
jgi:hypothetical protein